MQRDSKSLDAYVFESTNTALDTFMFRVTDCYFSGGLQDHTEHFARVSCESPHSRFPSQRPSFFMVGRWHSVAEFPEAGDYGNWTLWKRPQHAFL